MLNKIERINTFFIIFPTQQAEIAQITTNAAETPETAFARRVLCVFTLMLL